jgi:hypothetical protein
MILAQYNAIGFYDSLAARVWDRNQQDGGNEELFRVFFETNKIPAIQLIVSAGTVASMRLYNTNDEAVTSALTLTVESESGYKRLMYPGTTLSGLENGDYYLKITNGTFTYYSDVFGWTDDVSELLKISAISSDIRLGRGYMLNLTDFTYTAYINAEYLGLKPDIDDEVSTRYGVPRVLYANFVPTREFNVYGCEYIYRFLLGLRVMEANGTVSITWGGVTYTANDILVDKTDEHTPELMFQIKMSFVDISEVISVNNELN